MEGPGLEFSEAVIDNGKYGRHTIRFESGILAQQADGSAAVYLDGDTMLLAATTAAKAPRDAIDFWRAVFRRLICGNESLEDALEDISIYWNDDIEIIETFVIKTIKYSTAADGPDRPLLPMFKDAEDRDYAIRLLHLTMLRGQEYLARIDRHLKNWESDRVASMDRLIMQMAVAELINFPTIPVNVTLNEYIDAAKYYSTPKSSTFINGILDAVVQDLKEENKLVKVPLAKGARKDTDDDDDDE